VLAELRRCIDDGKVDVARRKVDWIEAEVERLTAERDKWQNSTRNAIEVFGKIEAENEQLMSDKAKVLAKCAILTAEQERLRSKLECIVALDLKKDEHGRDDFYSGPDRFFKAWNIAREALATLPTTPQAPQEK